MTRITSSLFLATLLALGLHVTSAQAQLVRTCVSMAKGSDSNSATCHCTTPCRTFATAAANTLADGEITVLDPGDYGGLTITRSISINNDSGGEASITVTGGTTGIIVSAAPGAYVNLRGLTIQGAGFGGGTGLVFNTGFSLTMENCVVRNHTGNGISFFPSASSNLSVSNTLVADNGQNGISVIPSGSGTVKAVFTRVEAYNNSFSGIFVNGQGSTGTVNATAADSVAGNNSSAGFRVNSASAATSLLLDRSVAVNNGTGLAANGATATLRVGQSTVTGNTTSWAATSSAVLRSYADNNIDGNFDADPAPTTIATK
jgi:Right handed beta helix region